MLVRGDEPYSYHWEPDKPSTGGSSVSVTPSATSGTEVATITVDGVATPIYAPANKALTLNVDGTAKEYDGTKAVDVTIGSADSTEY